MVVESDLLREVAIAALAPWTSYGIHAADDLVLFAELMKTFSTRCPDALASRASGNALPLRVHRTTQTASSNSYTTHQRRCRSESTTVP